MDGYTIEQTGAAYELARVIAQNNRREAEAVDGYTEQLCAIARAQAAFAGVPEALEYLAELEAATREKIADELSHSDSLNAEFTELTGIVPKEE